MKIIPLFMYLNVIFLSSFYTYRYFSVTVLRISGPPRLNCPIDSHVSRASLYRGRGEEGAHFLREGSGNAQSTLVGLFGMEASKAIGRRRQNGLQLPSVLG